MTNDLKHEFRQMAKKIDALTVIIGCPVWPKRELLSFSGQVLYDAILGDAKPYAMHVVQEEFKEAFAILGAWPANEFIASTLINDDDENRREANHRMLGVFKHYADAAGVEWSQLEGGKYAA